MKDCESCVGKQRGSFTGLVDTVLNQWTVKNLTPKEWVTIMLPGFLEIGKVLTWSPARAKLSSLRHQIRSDTRAFLRYGERYVECGINKGEIVSVDGTDYLVKVSGGLFGELLGKHISTERIYAPEEIVEWEYSSRRCFYYTPMAAIRERVVKKEVNEGGKKVVKMERVAERENVPWGIREKYKFITEEDMFELYRLLTVEVRKRYPNERLVELWTDAHPDEELIDGVREELSNIVFPKYEARKREMRYEEGGER